MADLDAFHLFDVSVDCDSPIVLANRISMMAERGLAEGLVTIASLDDVTVRMRGHKEPGGESHVREILAISSAESKPRVRLDGDE